MIDRRRQDLGRHLDDLRKVDGWHPFQNFVLGLLHQDGYRDVRHSNVRNDYGRDAVAITPDGKRCVVAVSFDCSRAKVLSDAKRSLEDPNREEAEVLLFVTAEAPAETTWSPWKAELAKLGLELRLFHRETILEIGTRDDVWRETCARLGIAGDRPGYRLIAPYDRELVRAALQARPAEWLGKLIELREWERLPGEVHNQIVLGKPGAGKTTTLLFQLEQAKPRKVLVVESDFVEGKVEELLDHASGGSVIVFDDAHAMPDPLRRLMGALLARQRDPGVSQAYQNVHLLLAARSQEWAEAQTRLPITQMQDLGLLGESQIRLSALTRAQCRALVEACRDAWNLVAEPRLVEHAATAAAERDASPLYVLSMLAPVRAREDRTLRDEHLAHLPPDVLNLWKLYWSQLSAVQQGVLRLVKLFAVTAAPASLDLFNAAARAFGLPLHEVSASLHQLESSLWISREDALPSCLDVQIEAVSLDDSDLVGWDSLVREVPATSAERIQLHVGTGVYYLGVRVPRMHTRTQRAATVRAAQRHFSSVSDLAGRTNSSLRVLVLNNASLCASHLAQLETTRESRVAWLQKAVLDIEEAVAICRELGVQGDMANSLNNVSNRYSDLARLETTRKGRMAWFQKAVLAVEEAVAIRREVGSPSDLASSLNNVSNSYADLAGLETMPVNREQWLQKAVLAVEEAIVIFRELGVQGDLAMSLNNISNSYSDFVGLEQTRKGQEQWLQKAVVAVEEAVAIYRELGVRGELAMSLNNLSNRYSDLAGLETTWDIRAPWVEKAVVAAEEAITIRRELGIPDDLAMSLTNVSNHYSDLAGLESKRDGRAARIEKAVLAVEEAIEIYRDLGVPAELAMSLTNLSNHYSDLAELEPTKERRVVQVEKAILTVEEAVAIHRELGVQDDLGVSLASRSRHLRTRAANIDENVTQLKDLRDSRDAIAEASRLFTSTGDMQYLLQSLQDLVIGYLLLAGAGDSIDTTNVRYLCEEGRELAQSMEDDEKIKFFENILGQQT